MGAADTCACRNLYVVRGSSASRAAGCQDNPSRSTAFALPDDFLALCSQRRPLCISNEVDGLRHLPINTTFVFIPKIQFYTRALAHFHPSTTTVSH